MRNRIFAFLLGVMPLAAFSAGTDLATVPLWNIAGTGSVKPNIFMMVDDSGSMDGDYLPDWANDNNCRNSAGVGSTASNSGCLINSSGTSQSSCYNCWFTTPEQSYRGLPFMTTGDINGVYYNPTITYSPPIDYTGAQRANITTYTSVKNDGYNIQSTQSTNLTTSYPDLEFCTDATYSNCLRNDNYLLPGTVGGVAYNTIHFTTASQASTGKFSIGSPSSSSASISRAIGPYYYLVVPGEYCTTPQLTTCVTANAPSSSYPYAARLRWCSDTARTLCQANQTTTYKYPRYPGLGLTSAVSGASASGGQVKIAAFAGTPNITLDTTTGLTVNGVNILTAPVTCNNCTNTLLATAIQGNIGAGFTVTSNSGGTITLQAPAGAAYNNASLNLSPQASGGTAPTLVQSAAFSGGAAGAKAHGQLTATVVTLGETITVSSINVNNGANILTASAVCANCASSTALAAAIVAKIGNGFTATNAAGVITVTSTSNGTALNTKTFTPVPVITNTNPSITNSITYTNFNSSGVNPVAAGVVPGSWKRIDINSVNGPFANLYVDSSGNVTSSVTTATLLDRSSRTDCAAAPTCTYSEEMTNFANWYSYYRTRMQMAKTAIGIAFNPLTSSYRVGFDLLSRIGYNTVSGMLLPGDFTGTQRQTFYTNLYGANPNSSTPLRTALDNIGKMYAGTLSGTSGVVQYACQQNFTIMTTDGYWNQTYSGSTTHNDGTASTNASSARFCTRGNGCLDALGSGAISLADVALYWYNGGSNTGTVSLRPSLDPNMSAPGLVPAGASDPNSHLHMTTYTMGLGVNGYMAYEKNYDTAPSTTGDYYKLITGASGCPWNSNGTYNWPIPASDSQTAVDDLWHAAVNGHGKYFSAKNPNDVVTGLAAAIANMKIKLGAASASATSTPNITQQDRDSFQAIFTTVKWYGELLDKQIDPVTGVVASTPLWSSTNNPPLGSKVSSSADSRVIKMPDGSGGLVDFAYGNMSSTVKSWFANKCSQMAQCTTLDATNQAIVNSGTNLVNYLRGQLQYADDTHFRAYSSDSSGNVIVLGDMASSKPAYVRDPRKNYTMGNYGGFKTGPAATRAAMVYVGSNDGMLHAFAAGNGTSGSGGAEMWAFVPRISMPNLYNLASTNYGSNHQFTVDGSPETADVQIGGVWKTILVGGLNRGGRGYYALDITDPAAPAYLWEFCADSSICSKSDPDIGYTYGNPQIQYWNGKWVVLVTSGYNNIPGEGGATTGNGHGILYVLDAATGTLLNKIDNGTGSATAPSGLARITAITPSPQTDPTVTQVYGGDLLGNLWRFDFSTGTPSISQMASLSASSAQPITTRPDVTLCQAGNSTVNVVLVGTGKWLGSSDATDLSTQTVYAIRDNGTAVGNPRSSSVSNSLTSASCPSSFNGPTCYKFTGTTAVDWTTKNGWYFDLSMNSGERVNVDPKIVAGLGVVATNLPSSASACSMGGSSFGYFVDICTGLAPAGVDAVGQTLSLTAPTVGFLLIKLPSGTYKLIATTADGGSPTITPPTPPNSSPARKTSWRTLQ